MLVSPGKAEENNKVLTFIIINTKPVVAQKPQADAIIHVLMAII